MDKKNLQAEIKAMQEYRKEAEELIEKMNHSVTELNRSSEKTIEQIKKQIEQDLEELSHYVSDEIYKTKDIPLSEFIERSPNEDYPVCYFSIVFNQKAYRIDKADFNQEHYSIAIVVSISNFPIYADGKWGDAFPDVANTRNWGSDRDINDMIEILCRNWPALLEGAYKTICDAYKSNTELKLQDTMEKSVNARIKYEKISAALATLNQTSV